MAPNTEIDLASMAVDEISTPVIAGQCTHTSIRSNTRCANQAIPGQTICQAHLMIDSGKKLNGKRIRPSKKLTQRKKQTMIQLALKIAKECGTPIEQLLVCMTDDNTAALLKDKPAPGEVSRKRMEQTKERYIAEKFDAQKKQAIDLAYAISVLNARIAANHKHADTYKKVLSALNKKQLVRDEIGFTFDFEGDLDFYGTFNSSDHKYDDCVVHGDVRATRAVRTEIAKILASNVHTKFPDHIMGESGVRCWNEFDFAYVVVYEKFVKYTTTYEYGNKMRFRMNGSMAYDPQTDKMIYENEITGPKKVAAWADKCEREGKIVMFTAGQKFEHTD